MIEALLPLIRKMNPFRYLAMLINALDRLVSTLDRCPAGFERGRALLDRCVILCVLACIALALHH